MSTDDFFLNGLLALSSFELSRMEEALPPNSPVVMDAAEGGAADALWSEMVQQGWLARQADQVRDSIAYKIFVPTESGRAPIGQLLAALRRDPRFLTRMSAIYNNLCQGFANTLLQEVRAAGGTGQDLAALTRRQFQLQL